MIGEIRDLETAQIAIQASLTGHLVLATLHTNDAVAAVTRLVDMGVERYLLASSLIGALSQRLVRCLCPVCRQAQPITDAERALLAGGEGAAAIHDAALPDRLWSAPGCPACRGLGYQERKGIYELMPASDALKQGIHEGAGEQALRRIARAAGMGSLRADALRYLAAGETSLDEVLRVTHD
jgi:general secretion pathway protein E